jgi:hypothetical protein
MALAHGRVLERRRQLSPKLVFAFSASLVVLIAAVIVVGVALHSGNSNINPAGPVGFSGYLSPLPDTALTPDGWAPFELGRIQVSVPGTWSELGGFVCPGRALFEETSSEDPDCVTASVTMQFASESTKRIPHARSSVVNGISVVLGYSGSGETTIYMERALGVDVEAEGSVAQQVLGTITYSPLSVVLDSHVRGTPSGWREIDYHGVRFDAPTSWSLAGSGAYESCVIQPHTVVLASARAASSRACAGGSSGPYMKSVSQLAGVPGMSVGSYPDVPVAESFLQALVKSSTQCLNQNGLRICIGVEGQQFASVFVGGSEVVSVYEFRSGDSIPTTFEIGLLETGLTALEIIDSIRAASSSMTTQTSVTISPASSGNPSTPTTIPAVTVPNAGPSGSNG